MTRQFFLWAAVAMAGLMPCSRGVVEAAPAVFHLEEATVAEIHAALDAGAISCQQLVQLYLNRIAAIDDDGPRLNAVTTVNPHVLSDAAARDAARRRSPRRGALHCIPVLLKDNIDTADMATSNGSVVLKSALPPSDAPIVKALRAEGAVILGKASLAEFAGAGGSAYNTIDGPIANPYNLKRQAGISSSGSAAAVAANLTVLAIGTDTSTSVRGPSAFSGIVGLRPTTGLVSRNGIAPKNLTFDTAGPIARTVTDVAMLLTVMAGPDRNDPLSMDVYDHYPAPLKAHGASKRYLGFKQFLKKGSLKGARLGIVRDFFGGDPEIDGLATAAVAKMYALGAQLVDVHLDPAFLEFYVRNGNQNIRLIADYRFKEDWEHYLTRFPAGIPKTVAEFLRAYDTTGSVLPPEDRLLDFLRRSLVTSTADPAYQHLIADVLPAATKAKLAIFERAGVDALVFPYQPTFAPPISTPTRQVDDPTYVAAPAQPDPAILAGYSSIGFPGIVVPMGFGSQGLPTAISFMGRPYDEGRIIGYAYDYEQATKWRRPPSSAPPLAGEVISYPFRPSSQPGR
jgi:amidase